MSGYDYVFVSVVPDEDTCPICSNPMKEPVQTKCGHRFCRLCLDKSMERMQECPIDRGALDADIPTDIFPDKASERKILDYEVKCPNENDGCQWIGELRNVEAHEASCLFVRVRCANDNCNLTLLRWDIQRHQSELCPRRTVSCQHCGTNYVCCLAREHFDGCQNFPCNCPQGCGVDDIPRNEMETHLERECGLTEVDCKYAHVGCQVMVPRNALHQHLQVNIEVHLNLACEKLQILENESMIRLEELEGIVTTPNNLGELHAAMDDILQRLEELERSTNTTSQLHSKTSEKLTLLEARLTGVVRKGELCDEMMENTRRMQQMLQEEIEAIRRRLQELPIAGTARNDRELQAGALRNSGLKLSTLVTPTAPPLPRPAGLPESRRRIAGAAQLPDMMSDGRRTTNEQSWQEFPGDYTPNSPRELQTEVHVSDKFIWKFTQFDDCLQKAKNGSKIYYVSEPFHTGPYGYKMRVQLHPNGFNDGWNTHLSIFVCLMKSEYDDILPWPFNKKVIITLIDQQPSPNMRRNIQMSSLPRNNGHLSICYSKPVEERPQNVAFGFCKFITQERIKSRRYLVNDTLFLCVEVEGLNSVF